MMLSRKFLRPTSQTTSLIRTFTTTSLCRDINRSPGLGDITPDGSEAFTAKQHAFRENLEIAKRKKEQADSALTSDFQLPFDAKYNKTVLSENDSPQAVNSSTVPTPIDPDGTDPVVENPLGIGSLKISSPIGEARQAEQDTSTKRGGKLSSLIYGTPEGQQMDQEMERSFSQLLARGKYVHSIVFHDVKPDKVDEYVNTVGKWYPRMAQMPENKVNLVGSWRTEVGDCDTFVHIWEYQRYLGYHQSLHNISSHPEFPGFDKHLKTLIHSKKVSLMQEFSFWPTTPPRELGGLFELRSYTLHPGNLLEWETHWRKGLKARKEVMEGVGAWFVQVGDLNTVHHLWQFANLEQRRLTREQSWGVEGWADTVHKTVPLIQTMKSKILIPMPWSPVR